MRKIVFSLLLLISTDLYAQQPRRILTHEDFLRIVMNRHPLALSAGLRIDQGRAQLQARRGAFDPMLNGTYVEKDFDGKDYYALTNSYLKWQSPFAFQLKGGYERNSGVYLNSENTTPEGGLWFAGVSLPLLQGLFIDEARGNTAIARVGVRALDNERKALLNTLALNASLNFWDWYEDAVDYAIDVEGLALARERFNFIQSSFRAGDRPAIDTLEAFIQVQNRELSLAERVIGLRKSSAVVEAWLRAAGDSLSVDWDPFDLFPNLNQVVENTQNLIPAEKSAIEKHPELQVYAFKEAVLRIERRMKWEKVKPKLNVEYTVLSGEPPAIPMEGQQGGRKIGVDFKMPLFLREERGELTLNRIKLRDNTFQLETKRQELTAKFEAFSVETRRLSEQIVAFQKAVENARLLLEAERVRFLNGDSSVFLINQRELSYLESRRKLNQLVAKFYKAQAGLNWSIASFPHPE